MTRRNCRYAVSSGTNVPLTRSRKSYQMFHWNPRQFVCDDVSVSSFPSRFIHISMNIFFKNYLGVSFDWNEVERVQTQCHINRAVRCGKVRIFISWIGRCNGVIIRSLDAVCVDNALLEVLVQSIMKRGRGGIMPTVATRTLYALSKIANPWDTLPALLYRTAALVGTEAKVGMGWLYSILPSIDRQFYRLRDYISW